MINIGNDKIKKLYKGNKLVTRVFKGDELIYRDFEAIYGFKFTIDTRYDYSKKPSTSVVRDFKIENYISDSVSFTVYWGDGSENTFDNGHSAYTHTYANHGRYQITIVPARGADGKPDYLGWGQAVHFGMLGSEHSQEKIVSYDVKVPPYMVYINKSETGARNIPDWFFRTYHLESVPNGFFDNVVFGTSINFTDISFSNMFCGTGVHTDLNRFTLAKEWFHIYCSHIDTSAVTNFTDTFYQTFAEGMRELEEIPADLFSDFDTSSGTNFTRMFYYTFRTGRTYFYSKRGTKIPQGLFDFIDTSNGTNFSNMFNGTFACNYQMQNYSDPNIPADLFDSLDTRNGTNFESMFASTFSGFANKVAGTIPNLFSHIQTPLATNVKNMFNSTFFDAFALEDSPNFSIPQGLFNGIDTSNCTSIEGLFQNTFYAQGGGMSSSITQTVVPSDLFANLNTSNCTNFNNAFRQTFRGGSFRSGIPDLFANLNTSSGVSFSGTFYRTFNYAQAPSIPATIFDNIDTSNGTNFSSMFEGTFGMGLTSTSTVPVPSTLFDNLDTSNGTNFSGMFKSTFYQGLGDGEIPAGIFDFLDMTNATYVSAMFEGTFQSAMTNNRTLTGNYTIPDLFSKVSVGAATDTGNMFASTFYGLYNSVYQQSTNRKVVVPANLFRTIDTSNVTKAASMFQSTFGDIFLTEIPQGIFGGIDLSNVTSLNNIFNSTFSIYGGPASGRATTIDTVLNDPFDGMPTFAWATAANANKCLGNMFAYTYTSYYTDATVGSASTVLQHFNFVPTSDTNMFYFRSGLTDYATIDNNWK